MFVRSLTQYVGAILALSLFAVCPLVGQEVLTSVKEIRALAPEQALKERPVVLHGTVTTLSGWKNSFFFDDGTAGVSVDRLDTDPPTTPGDRVEIHGHTGPGLFAPIVVADSVRVEGKGALPEPKVSSAGELNGGDRDSQWIGIRGTVRAAEVKNLWGQPRLILSVDIGNDQLVSAVVHDFDPEMARDLTSASVLLRGVCGTIFNDRRQFVGLRLFVSSIRDIVIERSAPKEPYDLPRRSLSGIMQFRGEDNRVGQIKVSGTVTWSKSGTGIYIQEGGQSLFVESGKRAEVPIGSLVEAVGYPSLGTYAPQLENSIFHVVSAAEVVKPADAPASNMIQSKDGFTVVPDDATLVRMKGKLLEQFVRGDDAVLLLQDGATVFTARIAPEIVRTKRFDVGSVLEVTGVCMVITDHAREPRSFTLLMRSMGDVVVIKSAPWWTARHAIWAVGVLALVALGMSGFIAFQRREAGLRALVVEDALTGLYNRRGFLAFGQDRWLAAQRQCTPVLLLYIDVDRFKDINDSFGHQEGDKALRQVATVLKESFRRADVIGRMGGDEFAVVTTETGSLDRTMVESQLNLALAQMNERARLPFKIELSVGSIVCDSSLSQDTIEDLLKRADSAMYEHKRKRRSARENVLDHEFLQA